MIDDAVTEADMAYFAALAKIVSDGLDACGYVYCPGDMMATNPRWCQPMRVWREYFRGWIADTRPEAQMLASVMFDLRPIGGARAAVWRSAGRHAGMRGEELDLRGTYGVEFAEAHAATWSAARLCDDPFRRAPGSDRPEA